MSFLFLIPYYLLFAFISWRHLKWAVYLICLTLPAYLIRFQIGPVPMTVLEWEILILFIIFLIKNYGYLAMKQWNNETMTEKKWLHCFMISLLIFFLTSVVSIFVSSNLRSAAGIWKAYFLEPILFFVVFVSVVKKEDLKNVFKFLSLSVLLLSLVAVYQKFTGAFIDNSFWAAEATRRVTSVFPYPNASALFLAPIVVAMMGALVSKCQSVKVSKDKKSLITYFLLLITLVAAAAAIYFTRSKGALLAILAGIIFYAIFFKGHRKFFIGILVVAFVTLLLYYFIAPANLANTLKGNATVTGGDSISTRLDMWSETWQMLKTRPILGAGLAGYQSAVAPFHQKSYIEVYLYPHNIFLNFWSEIGFFGLLAFLGIVIWFYKSVFSCHSGPDPEFRLLDPGLRRDDNELQVTSYKLQVTSYKSSSPPP